MPHTTPWHGHQGPPHPSPGNDGLWPAAVPEYLNQCADEHLQYCGCEQGPTDHSGRRVALVNLFRTTGTWDPRLRLIHPTRAKQDADTGPWVTLDSLHPHFGGYRRQGNLSPSTQWAAYHPPAALMYIPCDVLVDGEHQAPNADVAWPEPLRARPHATTPVWTLAIPGTVPAGEGEATSFPLHYGTHRPWVHTVDAEVIRPLLRHTDHEWTRGEFAAGMHIPWLNATQVTPIPIS